MAKRYKISLMKPSKLLSLALIIVGLAWNAAAQYTPTITGINAWWYMGGIVYDGPGCTTDPPGACYWSEAALTANPNGAPGTPSWQVETHPGGGSISLNCYTCTNVVATATAPSNGCVYDVTVTVSYGGYQSAAFNVQINTIGSMSWVIGYPVNSVFESGYDSTFQWQSRDLCGNLVYGYDANESFGTFEDDYYLSYGVHNTWNIPGNLRPNGAYIEGSLIDDDIGESAGILNTPETTAPQTPLAKYRR